MKTSRDFATPTFPDDLLTNLCLHLAEHKDTPLLLAIQRVSPAGWAAASRVLYKRVALRSAADIASFFLVFKKDDAKALSRAEAMRRIVVMVELDVWPGPSFIEVLASATAALELTPTPSIPLLLNAVAFRLGPNMLQQLDLHSSHGVDDLLPWPELETREPSIDPPNSTREQASHLPALKTHLLKIIASQVAGVLGAIRALFAPIHHLCLDFRALSSYLRWDKIFLLRDGLATKSLVRASIHGHHWHAGIWRLAATDTIAYMEHCPKDPQNDRDRDDAAATFGKDMESQLSWKTDGDQPTWRFVYPNTTGHIGLCEEEVDFMRRVRKKVLDPDVSHHFLKALSGTVYRAHRIGREEAILLFDRISNHWDDVLQFSHFNDTPPCPVCLSEFTPARSISWTPETVFDLGDVKLIQQAIECHRSTRKACEPLNLEYAPFSALVCIIYTDRQ